MAATATPEASTSIVQIEQITKRIGSKTIIDELSFEVPRGEVFGFLGPNGAGKTTTIRMMVGLMSITEGDIRIGGYSIRTHFEQAIRHVGAIVENPEMYKFLSGYYARMFPGIGEGRIDGVIDLVGMENRIHDKVKTYSLGCVKGLVLRKLCCISRPFSFWTSRLTGWIRPVFVNCVITF